MRLISSPRTAPVASLAALVTRSAASVGNRAPAVLRRSERRRFSSASDEEVGGLNRAMREQLPKKTGRMS
jgi:hypothetical protein